jgi:Na+-translocating ferredoxin:NAD+ oxidoreductase subunit B
MNTGTTDSLYRRLRQHLDRTPVGFPASDSGIELRILEHMFSPEEAEVALELSVIPEPLPTIHKRLRKKMTLPDLEQTLERMAEQGTILSIPVSGKICYAKLQYAVGMHERQRKRMTAEFERENRQYLDEKFKEAFHSKKITQLRIIPVNQQVHIDREVATSDQIRAHVETSPGPFAVITCMCRQGKDLTGESCRQTKLRDNCLMIGPAAQWAIDSGTGPMINRSDVLALVGRADEEGLVLQVENTKSPMFVCSCCGCCCAVLTSAKRFETPADYFSSNFHAAVDPGVCEGCGACMARCQMEAIKVPEGTAVVDRSRCIGCALCLRDCTAGAMRLEPNEKQRVPPESTQALYLKMFQDRHGPWKMAGIGARKLLGMKI